MVFLLEELGGSTKDHGLSRGLFSYGEKFSMGISMVFASDGLTAYASRPAACRGALTVDAWAALL